MRKICIAIITLAVSILFCSVAIASVPEKTQLKSKVNQEIVDELMKSLSYNQDSSPIKAMASAKDKDGKLHELPVKIATKKLSQKVASDGTITTEYITLASVETYQSSRSYDGKIKECMLTEYETTTANGGLYYIRFHWTEGWWERNNFSYDVRNAFVYTSQEGQKIDGTFFSDSDQYDIGEPIWNTYGTKTAVYSNNTWDFPFTQKDPPGAWGTRVGSDLYVNGQLLYDDWWIDFYSIY
ncbi:hypothetical protein [Moorella sp. E308F]|uniref:hypothetical protein n=1 Tax=Moorella sp. E308F TaxID=2572682 RepID=UPI0011440B27|nr:hypothetical protein [Moorella sp. E308F]